MTAPARLDTADLVRQVKALYRQVAQQPSATYHFPLGRPLAEQIGYPAELLDRIPAEALASFAGVGYALDLAALTPSKRVLDLGSGSGTDAFAAALLVGDSGQVTGVDMTDEQRAKARVFAEAARVLAPGGRLAMADIVATRPLPETVTCNADLWSACIGGAAPEADYRAAIEAAGLKIDTVREVPEYQFLTAQARNASREYGVRSITLAADRS